MANLGGKLIKFELNSAGVQELLKSAGVQAAVSEAAAVKAAEAGKGYTYSSHVGARRCYANIYPNTKEAAHDNYENNTLEKVIR